MLLNKFLIILSNVFMEIHYSTNSCFILALIYFE